MDYVTGVMTAQGYKRYFTPDGVEKLKELVGQGMASKDIADELGALTTTVQNKISDLRLCVVTPSFWSEPRVEQLKKLWADGLSASQIAKEMGAQSRMAVLGKVHRLGLAGRATRYRMASRRAKPVVVKAKRPRPQHTGNPVFRALLEAEPFVPSAEELVIQLKERKTVETLEACSCRWPIGDPREADFHFCGKQKITGLPYCEFHARRAFQVAAPRKRKPFTDGVTMLTKVMPPEGVLA